MKRILVCGGRDYGLCQSERDTIYKTLYDMSEWYPADEYGNTLPCGVFIITGGAPGADTVAEDWAVVNWVPCQVYRANWALHGNAAGAIRNQQMLDEGKPDVVVALPGGRGTADMIRRAEKAGVEVIRVG